MSRAAVLAILAICCAITLGSVSSTAKAVSQTFTVNTTADTFDSVCDANCSLRDAVFQANATGDRDTIQFAITGTGVKTFNLSQGLVFTAPIIIDGTTQAGANCSTHSLTVEIDGTNAGASTDGITINHTGSFGSLIKGVTVRDWGGHGIVISAGQIHSVRCSNIGTNAAGTAAAGNSGDGIRILAAATGSSGITIGAIAGAGDPDDQERNIISGNGGAGINTAYSGGGGTLKISGNYIGTDAAGNTAIPNHGSGVVVTSGFAEIGLSATNIGVGNVISGNTGANTAGVMILAAASGPSVFGNIIGLNAAGTTVVANENGVISAAPSTFVGKAGDDGRNIISGNTSVGIEMLAGSGGSIRNNYIGTNAAGTLARPNGTGVVIRSANTVGLAAPNVISGNTGAAAVFIGGGSTNSQFVGNLVGYAADGSTHLPNGGDGVVVQGDSTPLTSLVIGSSAVQDQNRIYVRRANGGQPLRNGIKVVQAPGDQPISGVYIDGNSIDSDGLGIDLRLSTDPDNQVTPNDVDDADTGPNGFLNFPVISEAFSSPSLKVKGTLTTAANQNFIISVYKSDSCTSATRIGQVFLGSFFAGSSGVSGVLNWESSTLTGSFSGGDWITVTARATTQGQNTSEFSDCFLATGAAVHTISQFIPAEKIAGSNDFTLRVLGSNFTNSMQIKWAGQVLSTTFIGSGELRATITTQLLGDAMQAIDVIVVDGQNESNTQPFPVRRSSSDVNCDGAANLADALFLLQVIAGISTNNTQCPGDVKQDGGVGLNDAVWIRKDVAGLVEPLLSPQQ